MTGRLDLPTITNGGGLVLAVLRIIIAVCGWLIVTGRTPR